MLSEKDRVQMGLILSEVIAIDECVSTTKTHLFNTLVYINGFPFFTQAMGPHRLLPPH